MRSLAIVIFTITPVYADWLYLKNGKLIETKGEIQFQKNAVVFTNTEGELLTLPLKMVDRDITNDNGHRVG